MLQMLSGKDYDLSNLKSIKGRKTQNEQNTPLSKQKNQRINCRNQVVMDENLMQVRANKGKRLI